MADPLMIPARFNGPPTSGNGGYCCGRFAALMEQQQTATVTLRAPPPLETSLQTAPNDTGVQVLDGDTLIADVRPGVLELEVPAPPSLDEATASSANYVGFQHHHFPGCFVCGPNRAEGDGLRIFPGLVEGRDMVASPWSPTADLADDAGYVRPEHVWAALDCPTYFASPHRGAVLALLGRLTARVDERPKASEPCIVTAWAIHSEGRKHRAASAVHASDGRLLAMAEALWVELKDPS